MFSNKCLQLQSFFTRNRRMIAGNWKSNNTLAETITLMNSTIHTLKHNPSNVDVIIAPITLHIPQILALNPTKQFKYQIAAQNASNYLFGAYTGEVSPKHLKDVGVKWTILGHSERRTLFHECDKVIVSKAKLAIECGLKIIYCFGETKQERESNRTEEVLDAQLNPLLAAFAPDSEHWMQNIVLAYEPVWAIGTGISSSPAQTEEVFKWLRNKINSIRHSDRVRILYGGSANAKNASEYLKIRQLDGLLVGGASLKPQFADIVKAGDQAI